jgi:lipopolysaccharide/colanic/teichoic acid biosynthesis glycosyltransferase
MQSMEVLVAVKWPFEKVPRSADRSHGSVRNRRANPTTGHHQSVYSGPHTRSPGHSIYRKVSPWPVSRAKRCFDVTAVIAGLPLVVPVLLAVGLAVRMSSRGPVLFVQTRMGRYGRRFKIFKFRTMTHRADEDRPLITTVGNQRFTPVGRFLRKWKLDELPQILNVLRGDMSLVGPRPKVPDHQREVLLWRPGITGAATLVFAREEVLLYNVPGKMLDRYVQRVVLPAKRRIDAEYMSRATFTSDLSILIKTVLRRWNYNAAGSSAAHAAVDSLVTSHSASQRLQAMGIRETVPVED